MAKHDRTWKRLFSFPDLVRDLLAGFVLPEWAEDLQLATLEPGSAILVSDTLRERLQDRVWRVRHHDRRLDLMVCLEFQSTVDRTMAVRVLDYSTLLYQELLRNRERRWAVRVESGGKGRKGRRRRAKPEPLPPVLPIVLYHGRKRWRAKEDVAGLCAPSASRLAPYQPSQRYFLLDVGRYTGPLPEEHNWMAALVRLARTPDPEVLGAELLDMSARWPDSEYDSLLEAVLTWLGRVHFPMHRIDMEMPELVDVREAITVLQQVGMDWSAKLRAEGRVEGRSEGQAEIMRWQAARKFGEETAERLAGRLAAITDPKHAKVVGEWLLECESGEELLARVARLCKSPANGDGARSG